MKNRLLRIALCLGIGLFSFIGFSQEYNNFEVRYQNNLRGDLTFIGNNIVNRDGGTSSTEPNDPYNNLSTDWSSNAETGGRFNYNDYKDMRYIDVDNDPSTFSSSSATFNFPQADCNLIRYAGLYWSATYPRDEASDPIGTPRQYPIDQIRFRVPGGTYVDVTADEILYDGLTDPALQSNSPYACYADVTSLITALPDPTGVYTAANIPAAQGIGISNSLPGGSAGGWTLVVVYENPTLTGKLITTFDGFARVTGTNSVNIPYSGFETIPVGPVNASLGAATLEGDFRIAGDGLSLEGTALSNASNPVNNFFNSNITLNGADLAGRTPSSLNTLGYDTDIFMLSNPANSVLSNGQTSATFTFSTNGDQYYPFFNSFNVEIIEPNIVLEKRVEDIAGNDITGAGVNLGQLLDYVLTFQNIGNDDATNYTIRDVLPINVTLDESSLNLPPGVTYVYDAPSRTITFTIPDNLIEENDPPYDIRMRVQVAENCFDFIDACTDLIENLAFSTYQGVINTAIISDDPSVTDFDSCGYTVPGATNFLLDDLENCDFTRTVQLCGDDVVLDAGDNFDSYTWYLDNNGDHLIDPGDTVITDGDPDNDPSTLLVSDTGTYIVDKDVADPCKGFQEIIIVTLFGATQTNPITDLINDTSNTVEGEIVVCPNDGEELPQVFLCGLNDTELIQINIPDAQSIVWEQLDEASCPAATPDCANKDNGCTWNTVDTGSDFLASDAGQYRLQINYQNGCFSRFYFNIYKNPLDPQYNSSDIICNTPGNITVTNMPIDYEYQLVDAVTNNILVGYQSSPSFDITTNGAYRVEMRQQGVVDGCVFVLDNIGILDRDFQVDVTATDAGCTGLGEISISILNVEPQYYYELSQGGTLVDSFGPSTDNNYTFENLNPGTYDILATTDDGCSYNEQVVIQDLSDLELTARVSQHITCREGNILMSSDGGRTPHTYAIWTYVDVNGVTQTSYASPNDIPPSEFQTSQIFDIFDPGQYTFIVVDRNNCFAVSNPVDIEFRPAADFDPTTVVDVLCFGDSSGAIQFNLIDNNGYQLTYYLFDATTFDENNYDYADALATNASGNFPGLPAGDYAIVVNQRKGSASCDYVEYQTVSAPTNGLAGDAVIIQPYTCLQLGIIEAQNVSGGTAPYEYSIDGINFVPSPTFSNLTDGAYTITIRDSAGCTLQTNSVTLDPLNPPTDLTFTATPPNCPAQTSDVVVTVVDGEAPYVFEIIAPAAIAASSITGNSANFDALTPDTYTFRVTDANGCTYDEDFTIAPVVQLNVVGQVNNNISCFGDANGEATITVTDFTATYSYNVTGPSNFSGIAESSGTINLVGLAAGTYDITVTDDITGCIDTASVTIDAPAAPLTLSVAETQPTCTVDGSVVLSATGGWGGNSFDITYPDGTTTFTNSTGAFNNLNQSGTYNVSVTDANGCVVNDSFVLNAAIAPVLQVTPNDFCYDDATGLTLTATITSGGDGNFEYSLNGGVFGTNNVFTGLGPGTYTIDVRDGNDCTDSETITINPELTVTATASNITACATGTDINIAAAGGDGNYVYAVVGDGVTPTAGDFAVTNPVTVTGAGDYDVYVRDNNGGAGYCEASFDISIAQDPALAVTPTVTDVSCFGGNDGAISLAASGGEAPYEYSIDNGVNYQVSPDFFNLTAGSYTVRVRDANNCDVSMVVTVAEPAQLVAEAQLTQDYTCLQLGEITVGSITPTSGGSGNYQYSLNGGTWSAPTTGGITYTDLTNGTYTIQVRDANEISCLITLADIVIDPLPAEPAISFSVAYNCDGTGNITVSPNDPSYTYSLDGGAFQASNVFTGVAPGNHTVTVNYGSDCTTQADVLIESGQAFDASIIAFNDITCNAGNDGSITFEVVNFDGVNGFEYEVNGGGFSAAQTSSPITLSGLTAGAYTIEVRDVLDNSCSITLNHTLNEPTAISVSDTLTQPTCVSDGSVVITATGGTGGYTYEIEQPDTTILGPQSSNIFNNLTQFGLHTITVTDANGCTATDTFTTVAPSNPTASIDAASDLCYSSSSNATVVVGATGGVAPYQYSVNGGALRSSNTFDGLVPGNYTFTVTDSYGCTDDVSITIEPQLTADLVLTKDLDCTASPDAVLTLNVNGGYTPYTYEININSGGYVAYGGGLPYTTMTAGAYQFRVTDAQGCVAESNIVTVSPTENPQATTNVTEPTCNGDSNGIVEIIIDTNFGSAPYEVSFDGGPFSSQRVYPGLTAGTYSYTVRDAKNCIFNGTATLSDPDPFLANVVATDVSCGPGGDVPGQIDITITSGGTADFTYTLYDNLNNIVAAPTTNPIVTSATSVTFDNLDFGDYYVRIIDANGCEYYENPVRVLANPYLSVNSTVTVDCATGGTVELLSTGGSGDYTFTIFATGTGPTTEVPGPGANEETATFTGLNTGQTYIFQVIDNVTGCSSYVEETIPALSAIDVVANPTVNDVSCFGDTDGSISFQIEDYDGLVTDINYEIRESLTNNPLGAGYSGTISGPAGPGPTALETVNNIPPGDYVLYFEEATSPFCSNTFDFRILEPNPVTLTLIDQNTGNCNEDANVTVLASGGSGSFTYAFVEDGVVPVAGDYTASNYAELDPAVNTDWDVHVLDSNNCPGPILDITIADDPDPVISATVDQCSAEEGDFTITVTLDAVGIGPYTLSLDGGAYQSTTMVNVGDTHLFTNLSSGNHTITLRDANACGNTVTVDIFTPPSLTADVTTQPTCLGGDGEVVITAYGGSGVYEYELFDAANVSVNGAPQASPIFTGLDAGMYTAFVYDQILGGCNASVDVELEIPQAVSFTTTATDVTCFGDSDGTITATLNAGMNQPPYTYQLFDSTGLIPQTGIQTSNIFTGLAAGDYVVRVYSGRGCQDDMPETVGGPAPIANVNANVVEFACTAGNSINNASITIDAAAITGGSGNYVIYEFINDQGTPAVGDDVVVQSGANNVYIETDVAGGSYTINVYDDNGCLGSTTAIIQPFDELLTATAAITNPLSCDPGMDGEITITVTSTNNDPSRFEYSIDNGANYQASNVFSGLGAGTHNFVIRHIDTGCIITASETIANPNTFTVDVTVVSDVTCFGTQSGQATFELIDATYAGPIDWEVFDTNGTPSNRADDVSVTTGSFGTNGPTTPPVNLFAGEYLVEVTQANFPGCSNIEIFTIAGPPAALTGAAQVTDITCLGNDGIIEIINAAGGWGNYSYYVSTTPNPDPNDSSNYTASPRFENLSAGTYEIWIIDQNGCSVQLPNEVLVDPTPITATLQINQENCTNLQGEIEVVGVSGGQNSNYTYQLILNGSPVGSPQTSPVFSGLGAGSYEVLVADQWSCTFTTAAELLYEEMNAVATVIKPIDCTPSPDGEITVTVTGGSSNLDYTVTFPDGFTTLNNTTGVFTGLSQPGTYTFVVQDLDTNNPVCTVTVTQDLDAPTPVTFDPPTIIDVSCFGGSDGSVTINLEPQAPGVNDNPPYTYNLYDSGGALLVGPQSSPTFAGLSADTYQIEAISSRGCSDRTNVVINEPNALVVAASATPFACNANNTVDTSTITVTATDGTGPYLYSLDNISFQTSNTFEIIDNGSTQNITLFVQDANGCSETANVVIEPLNTFTLNAAQNVAITCVNPEELTLTVVESGVPGDTYTFLLLPVGNPNGSLTASTSTTATFELTAPGNYTFRATNDTTGCYQETTYSIAPYDLISVTAVASAPVTCFGDGNGAIDITVSGYSGGYAYEVFDNSNNSITTGVGNTATNPLTISGLSGGNYYVRVTETDAGSSLCDDDSNVVTIVSPDIPLTVTSTEVANVACTNDQGEILVDASGGYPPYDIVLTNTTLGQSYTQNNVSSFNFTGLSAGNYTVQVTDDQGCVINDALTLVEPSPITADITATPTTLACYGDTNAVITAINETGGSGNYNYQLNEYDATGTTIAFTSGVQSSPIFAGLGAGIYSITVSDGWNCDVETVQVTINEPSEVMASLVEVSPMSCTNQAEMLLTASGGTGPYEFSSDGTNFNPMGGGNTHTFNVGAGVYQYFVRDSFGCVAMISNQVSIEMVPPLAIAIDDTAAFVNCTDEASATIVATATGGLGNYSYELFTDPALTNLVAGPQSSDTFSGLLPGNYYVRVTSQDCVEVSPVVTIANPMPLQVDRQEFTNVTCAGEEDGTITVEVSGGTGQILYAITPNLNQFDTMNTFTDLAPGIYDVIAQDEYGCFMTFQFEIIAPEPLNVETVQVTHEVCVGDADGTIEISIEGGTAPYRTGLNSNDEANMVADQTFFSGLAPGTYVIFVRDAEDCEANVIVEIEPGVNLDALVEPIYECNGNIPENRIEVTLADDSIANDVLYALDSTDPADFQLSSDFSNLAPGSHYLTIAHANGCINTIDFEIDSFEPLTLVLEQNNINEITAIASGGSPEYTFIFDGDNNGTDNTYYINRTDTFTVTVIDQLGCEVSAQIYMEFIDIEIPNFFTPDGDGTNDYWLPDNLEGFPNVIIKIYDRYGRVVAELSEGHQGWDGNYNKHPLPTGDYWYVVRLNGENDDREFVGHFTLYR